VGSTRRLDGETPAWHMHIGTVAMHENATGRRGRIRGTNSTGASSRHGGLGPYGGELEIVLIMVSQTLAEASHSAASGPS
jgi:hypothetical protein